MSVLVLRDVEVDDTRVDVRVEGGVVVGVGSVMMDDGADVVDGRGGALLPGLWDHHIHLMALAAAHASVQAGPPAVRTVDDLAAALRDAPGNGWVRAVGYHESVAGELDRYALDRLIPERPTRVQHRSGALWVLNSRALGEIGSDSDDGRLFGADRWLRDRLPASDPPDVAAVGRMLARYGVVGVTDMTPYDNMADLAPIANGGLALRVVATGSARLAGATFPPPLRRGPVKIVVADHALPTPDDVAECIAEAHRRGRRVAIHCVTRVALALAVAAWEQAGAVPGDRIEHGSVIPPDLRAVIGRHGITVVTNPTFVAERGDEYRADVDDEDMPHVYPCASLLQHGVAVAAGTDAPD